jgi:hypothetical protein
MSGSAGNATWKVTVLGSPVKRRATIHSLADNCVYLCTLSDEHIDLRRIAVLCSEPVGEDSLRFPSGRRSRGTVAGPTTRHAPD